MLIIGVSTGIGLAVARALRDTRRRTILTARKESLLRFDILDVKESDRVRIRALDITSETEREAN